MRLPGSLLLVVATVVVLIGLLWLFQRRLVYFPSGWPVAFDDSALSDIEPVSYTTEDGLTLRGWFLPARGDRARWTVLVFSGNAGNRAMRTPLGMALQEAGYSVLLTDYRGYADNPGRPSETALAADARAARAYLDRRAGAEPNRIAYFGESLGSAVAVSLALERPPAALILRSPFTSLVDVARYHYRWLPVEWMLWDRYPSIDRIRHISCPLLVIAGDRDTIVPTEQSLAIHEAAPSPKRLLVVAGADHNDYTLLAGAEMLEAIRNFLGG